MRILPRTKALLAAAVAGIGAARIADSQRRYYDPGANPFPRRLDGGRPDKPKKKPRTRKDWERWGRAEAKRQRKAEQRKAGAE